MYNDYAETNGSRSRAKPGNSNAYPDPPKVDELEKIIVGSLMLAPDMLADVLSTSSVEDFHHVGCRLIVGEMAKIKAEGLLIDEAILLARLPTMDGPPQGWTMFVFDCTSKVEQPANAPRLAEHVAMASRQRQVARLAEELRIQATRPDVDLGELLAEHRELLAKVGAPNGKDSIEYRQWTAPELDAGSFKIEYLVEGVLVAGQPAIVAAPKKACKTSMAIDLGLSLASKADFLGHFKVNRAIGVGLMSGESGLATIQETQRRIAYAKDIFLADAARFVLTDQIPKLSDPKHLDAIRRFIERNELELLMIDPTYLALPGADAGNLFIQGEMLLKVAEVCAEFQCAPLLVHHLKRGVANPHEPPELEDIAWAGFQEFARQWILLGRRERYEPGTGHHELWLNYGGSAGHSGLWGLTIDEGADYRNRFWEVTLEKAADVREELAEKRADAKATAKDNKQSREREARLETDRRKIVEVLAKLPNGESEREIRMRTGYGVEKFKRAWVSLVDDGTVVEAGTILKGKTEAACYRLNPEAEA